MLKLKTILYILKYIFKKIKINLYKVSKLIDYNTDTNLFIWFS